MKTAAEMLEYFNNDAYNVKDHLILNENMIALHYKSAEGFVDQNVKTNTIIASFMTALARLKLYSILDQLQDKVLYHDTNSMVFVTDPSHKSFDLKTGDFLGEVTTEMDDSNEEQGGVSQRC